MLRMSKSKANTYLQCPYRFKLSYIDKIEVPKAPALQKGIECHELMDCFYAVDTEDIELLIDNIKRHKYYLKHAKIVENFISFNHYIESCGNNIRPAFSEIEIYDEETDIIGIIDRVDITKDTCIVIDYKTGKYHPINDYRFELGVYTFLFEKKYNINVTHWGIFFVEQNKLLVELKSDLEVHNSMAKMEEVRQKIKSKEFPKIKTRLCDWCPFKGKQCK